MYWNQSNESFIGEVWADSVNINPAVLDMLLSAANELCVAYAPTLSEGDVIPDSWLLAEILQARHIWSQASGGDAQQVNADGFVIPTYPLVFAARDLLRPKSSPLSRLGR